MNHKDNTDMNAYRKIESIDIDPKKMFNDSYHVSKNTMDPFTEKIGIGVESIKIIKNFMPQNDIDIVLKFAHAMYEKKFNNDWQENRQDAVKVIGEYKEKIINKAQSLFSIKLEHDDSANYVNIQSDYLNGREPFFLTDIHTDFLGDEKDRRYLWSGHISNLLYLNNNYNGGELYFPQHNLKIKPEKGMLVSFPGNFYNRHGICPADNFRYAINIFTKISNFPNYFEYK